MDSQLYLDIGATISQLTGRTLARVHPQLGVKVSPCGEVLVPQSGKNKAHWTFGCKNSWGYMQVKIARKTYRVHRLVLQTFAGPCPEGMECNHKNRDRSDNRLENLEWVTHSDNNRNTSSHDRVEAQGRTHYYEDEKQYNREYRARYKSEHPEKVREQRAHHYSENRGKILEQQARYEQAKCKTHRRVHFADGSYRWVPLAEAEALLKLPLSQRIYKE